MSYISRLFSSKFSKKEIILLFNSKNNFLIAFSEHPFFMQKPNKNSLSLKVKSWIDLLLFSIILKTKYVESSMNFFLSSEVTS